MKLLYQKAKLVHGDLSEFNILNFNENPVLIDLSHSTPVKSAAAEELLNRDIANICRYFKKIGLELKEEDVSRRIKNS